MFRGNILQFDAAYTIQVGLLAVGPRLRPTLASVITAATRDWRPFLGLDQLGTVGSGKSADFLVLDANPRENIANTRRISRVYLRCGRVERLTLPARWPLSTGSCRLFKWRQDLQLERGFFCRSSSDASSYPRMMFQFDRRILRRSWDQARQAVPRLTREGLQRAIALYIDAQTAGDTSGKPLATALGYMENAAPNTQR